MSVQRDSRGWNRQAGFPMSSPTTSNIVRDSDLLPPLAIEENRCRVTDDPAAATLWTQKYENKEQVAECKEANRRWKSCTPPAASVSTADHFSHQSTPAIDWVCLELVTMLLPVTCRLSCHYLAVTYKPRMLQKQAKQQPITPVNENDQQDFRQFRKLTILRYL